MISLELIDFKVNSMNVDDVTTLLNAPSLKDVSFLDVEFAVMIPGVKLEQLTTLRLRGVYVSGRKIFAEDLLRELFLFSKKLVNFENLASRYANNLLEPCLKVIGDSGCKLETLKVHHYHNAYEYLALLEPIFKNSRATLREISFSDHKLPWLSIDSVGKFIDSFCGLEQLDTLEMSKIEFGNPKVRAKFCDCLKSFKKLTKLTLDVIEFCKDNGGHSKSIHTLPAIFHEFTNLDHLSLNVESPADPEVLSSIEKTLEAVKTSLTQLDVELEISSGYVKNQFEPTKKIFQMLRAQHAFKNLKIRSMYGISEDDDVEVLFDEISKTELDSLSIINGIGNIDLHSAIMNALRQDAKIRSLEIATWLSDTSFMNTEVGKKLAAMNALSRLSLSIVSLGCFEGRYLEFLDGLSESSTISELHISSDSYKRWGDKMCSVFTKFRNLESIVFSSTVEDKDFKARITRCLSGTNIAISYSLSEGLP